MEELAYLYETDKSHDDHKYVDVYASLFDSIRDRVSNFTEIGVATGQSMQMWNDYFHNAKIYGLDKQVGKFVRAHFVTQPRVKLKQCDAYSRSTTGLEAAKAPCGLAWSEGSMDIIIDDAQHVQHSMEKLLVHFWRFVRPGGYYIIEDVGNDAQGLEEMNENAFTSAEARQIVEANHAYFIDPLFGHRNFSHFANTSVWGNKIIESRTRHANHMAIIRKRAPAHPGQPWRQFWGATEEGHLLGAMTLNWMPKYYIRNFGEHSPEHRHWMELTKTFPPPPP